MNKKTLSIDEEIEAPASIVLQGTVAFCCGSGPSGHPEIYLSLPPGGAIVCPYCNQHFENLPPSTEKV